MTGLGCDPSPTVLPLIGPARGEIVGVAWDVTPRPFLEAQTNFQMRLICRGHGGSGYRDIGVDSSEIGTFRGQAPTAVSPNIDHLRNASHT
jgi:hypothetical protein